MDRHASKDRAPEAGLATPRHLFKLMCEGGLVACGKRRRQVQNSGPLLMGCSRLATGWTTEGSESSPGGDKHFLYVVQTGIGTHPDSHPMGTGGNAAGVWSWPLTINQGRGQENADLYIYSPTRLHGAVLNYSSTGTTLPLLNNFRTHCHFVT
jgi:hypothetical protein